MTAIGKAAVQISSRKGGKVPEAEIQTQYLLRPL
jgi:hypothetical protein